MLVGSRAIIRTIEKYAFVKSILLKNVISYCFLCNFAKFCRFSVVCNIFDLAPRLWVVWWVSPQNMQAYHVCIMYLARAIFKSVCFCWMYWSKLRNLCCFVWRVIVFLLFSLFSIPRALAPTSWWLLQMSVLSYHKHCWWINSYFKYCWW